MGIKQFDLYDNLCNQIFQIHGIRFAAIINNRGRKIAGGFGNEIIPLEKDQQKIEMLFMEIALDMSMRKEFNNSLGNIHAIVSYRDKATIIAIPNRDDLILLSIEPELDPSKIIQIIHQCFMKYKILEV